MPNCVEASSEKNRELENDLPEMLETEQLWEMWQLLECHFINCWFFWIGISQVVSPISGAGQRGGEERERERQTAFPPASPWMPRRNPGNGEGDQIMVLELGGAQTMREVLGGICQLRRQSQDWAVETVSLKTDGKVLFLYSPFSFFNI